MLYLYCCEAQPPCQMSLSNSQKRRCKMIPVQSILFPGVLQEPNILLVPGIRVISSAESRKYHKRKQHTKPYKLRHSLPGTLQQFVPAGTAVHIQRDRRRASDGGRAICTQHIQQQHYLQQSTICIFFELHNVYEFWYCCVQPARAVAGDRRWASDGGRAIIPGMYVPGYSSISSGIYIFSVYILYQQSSTSTKFLFFFSMTRTNFQRRRASDGGQATTYE